MSPSDGASTWEVVDDDFELHEGGCAFLTGLRAADRSVNTERVYAGRVALFLSWCAAEGVDWTRPRSDHMVGFKRWLVADPAPTAELRGAQPRRRSAKCADAVLPAGFEPGEEGQHRSVCSRLLRFSVAEEPLGFIEPERVEDLVAVAGNARDRFALARAEITRLRAARDRQSHLLRLALGARVDQLNKTGRVTELEDDLAAARTSLRRMTRAENLPAPVNTTSAVATTNGRSR